jgi:predicted RNase H-related nuclease YkuK (DUF458 family)
MKNLKFISPSKGILSAAQMIEEIKRFVMQEPSLFYRLVIGTDSQAKLVNGKDKVDYVTAVIVHRKGRGARYFWRKETQVKKVVLRQKIYTETLISLDIAQDIVPLLREAVSPVKYDLEIHIDVGPLGPTRDLIKEVVGMVNGSGYKARTKPESWGASSVADKHT